jgi:hypothetical protein
VQTPGKAHAKIAPSSLDRLFACPGSHTLSAGLAPGKPSRYAAHGTAAHALAEECLRHPGSDPVSVLGSVQTHDGYDIEVDEEMVEGVRMYLDEVRKSYAPGWVTWIEEKVDLTPVFPGGLPDPIFGTADFIGWNKVEGLLRVVDLKFGRGGVSPIDNPQVYAYALGAVFFLRGYLKHRHSSTWFPDWIEVTIVQPRGMPGQAGVKTERFTGLDLEMWMNDVFVPGVQAVYSPSAKLVVGDHCHFCPAKAVCPALAAHANAVAMATFDALPPGPVTLSDAELSKILDWADVLHQWVDAIRSEASRRIDLGGNIPGWKLVPKRAMRKWLDGKTALDDLVANYHLPIADVAKLTVLSPAQIEKKHPLTYDDLEKRGLIDRSSSGTTLVPDHDTRNAVIARSGTEVFPVLD